MSAEMMPLKFRLLFEGNGPMHHFMQTLANSQNPDGSITDLSGLKHWVKINLPIDIKHGSVDEANDRILVLFDRALDYSDLCTVIH
jgi:hypothetical protein